LSESSHAPLIFAHYGAADYLSRSLQAARLTNPERRLVLIGDDDNRQIALQAKWEHFNLDDYSSDLRAQFQPSFQEVKGSAHISPRGSRNWLQFVSERWFIVTAFAQAEGIPAFWHFDSDVMIVTDLDPFERKLLDEGADFTKQCSGACLNGFVTTKVAEAFCRYIIAFLHDDVLMAKFRAIVREYPTSGLSEMDFFSYFDKQTEYRGYHLESHFPGWWFDDVLCQDDGCETARMGVFGPVIKDIHFDEQSFFVMFNGRRMKLAVLNCSWLPTRVFDWILARTRVVASGQKGRREERLRSVWPGFRHEYRGLRSRIYSLLKG
jgi:hypothetical protein